LGNPSLYHRQRESGVPVHATEANELTIDVDQVGK
jgi:hypothetical protein